MFHEQKECLAYDKTTKKQNHCISWTNSVKNKTLMNRMRNM